METEGNASIIEVEVVPTTKEVTEIDLTYSPKPKVNTKTVICKTAPKTDRKGSGINFEQIQRAVHRAIDAENKDYNFLWDYRFRNTTGKLVDAVMRALPGVDFEDMKTEIDLQLSYLL